MKHQLSRTAFSLACLICFLSLTHTHATNKNTRQNGWLSPISPRIDGLQTGSPDHSAFPETLAKSTGSHWERHKSLAERLPKVDPSQDLVNRRATLTSVQSNEYFNEKGGPPLPARLRGRLQKAHGAARRFAAGAARRVQQAWGGIKLGARRIGRGLLKAVRHVARKVMKRRQPRGRYTTNKIEKTKASADSLQKTSLGGPDDAPDNKPPLTKVTTVELPSLGIPEDIAKPQQTEDTGVLTDIPEGTPQKQNANTPPSGSVTSEGSTSDETSDEDVWYDTFSSLGTDNERTPSTDLQSGTPSPEPEQLGYDASSEAPAVNNGPTNLESVDQGQDEQGFEVVDAASTPIESDYGGVQEQPKGEAHQDRYTTAIKSSKDLQDAEKKFPHLRALWSLFSKSGRLGASVKSMHSLARELVSTLIKAKNPPKDLSEDARNELDMLARLAEAEDSVKRKRDLAEEARWFASPSSVMRIANDKEREDLEKISASPMMFLWSPKRLITSLSPLMNRVKDSLPLSNDALLEEIKAREALQGELAAFKVSKQQENPTSTRSKERLEAFVSQLGLLADREACSIASAYIYKRENEQLDAAINDANARNFGSMALNLLWFRSASRGTESVPQEIAQQCERYKNSSVIGPKESVAELLWFWEAADVRG
ncbi:hypothetical protein cyc_05774 [Cyclospora cayetanensis]|uniref:Uncharacterized protein n=1 Tax=Cyclospora cayetanensis TaxID=88456 RepID=A0A1D3D650_9EIME|nr:hypothetical protein cyc_05774 [Cyclospora cayetanensis]